VTHETDGFLFTPGDSKDAAKYIQQLKDDKTLRADMGRAGKAAVTSRTVENVVKDLMEWYGKGTFAKRNKFLGLTLFALAMLGCTVPFTIFIFSLYDIMVSYILKPFIHYDTHDPPTNLIVSAPSCTTLAPETTATRVAAPAPVVEQTVVVEVTECATNTPTDSIAIDPTDDGTTTEATTELGSSNDSTPTSNLIQRDSDVGLPSDVSASQDPSPSNARSKSSDSTQRAVSRKNRKGKK